MLNNINHKMAVYKDCTLIEIMVTAIVTWISLILALSISTKLLFNYFWPGYLIATLLFFLVTKLLLSKLQKLKYGKPHAYYQHLIVKRLNKIGLVQSVYLTRIGRWSVRRMHP